MKIYISHSRELDYVKELYEPIKETSLFLEHEFFFPHDNNLEMNTKDFLSTCDILLAETSLPSTGQGIEMGRAESCKIPILCFTKADHMPSGSIRYVSDKNLSYTTTQDLIHKITQEIKLYTINTLNSIRK